MNCHDDSHFRTTYGDEVIQRCNTCGASLMDEPIRFGEHVVEDVALKVKLLDVFHGHPGPHVHDSDRVHVSRLHQTQLLCYLESAPMGGVLTLDSMDKELRVRISNALAASQKRDDSGGMKNSSAMGDYFDWYGHQKVEKHHSRLWASAVRGHQEIKRLWLLLADRFRNFRDQKVHCLTGNVVEKVNVEGLHINSLANDERMHLYQRGRASITGLMVELQKIIETGQLVGVA